MTRATGYPLKRRLALGLVPAVALMLATPPALAQAPQALEKGRELYFEGDYEGARQAWAPLAEEGNPRALYNMATLYRRGLGVEENSERAHRFLAEAAETGFAEAQYLLAALTMRDDNASESERQAAVRWWLTAARKGHALSQYRLGLLYWNGEAVARDLVRGFAWVQLAAEDGLEDAQTALETMESYLDAEQRETAAALQTELLEEADGEVVTASGREGEPQAAPRASRTGDDAESETDGAAQSRTASTAADTHGGSESSDPAESDDDDPSAEETDAAAAPSAEALEGAWRLQLAAFRDRATAEATWRDLEENAPDLVSGLAHRIVSADVDERGTFHRLQIGPFDDRSTANRRCRALKAAGYGCFPVAPGS